jgi:hypothetical protein
MKLIGVIFTCIGLLFFLIGGFLFYQEFSFRQSAVKVQGTVKEIGSYKGSKSGTQYYPVVEFRTEDGKLYTFKSDISSSSPEYTAGETVIVYYDPKDPLEADLSGLNEMILIGSIFGGIGLVFGSIGGIFLFLYIRRQKEIAWLKQNGTAVEADFDSVEHDTSYKVNNKSPYVIHCRWFNPYNGEMMDFKSEYIWYDPTSYITNKKLQVLIDVGNPKKHFVDISFLPKS